MIWTLHFLKSKRNEVRRNPGGFGEGLDFMIDDTMRVKFDGLKKASIQR